MTLKHSITGLTNDAPLPTVDMKTGGQYDNIMTNIYTGSVIMITLFDQHKPINKRFEGIVSLS